MSTSTFLTAILGILSLISAPLITVINNHHARALKKLELKSSESLKKFELNAELSKEFLSSDRELKYEVFFKFTTLASRYIFDYQSEKTYSELLSAYTECLAIGLSPESLNKFMEYVHHPSTNRSISSSDMNRIQNILQEISQDFNNLLNRPLDSSIND